MLWERFLDAGLAMWSFFMLPMSVTALTLLLAQIEHGPRMWTHLLVLPVRRGSLILGKALVALLLLAAMQILVFAGLYTAGFAIDFALSGKLSDVAEAVRNHRRGGGPDRRAADT